MMEPTPTISNVLAERYASKEMRRIWSREEKIQLERNFWIAVMRAQSKHGVPISPEDISRYEEVSGQIDLISIDQRERALRHDVKARIEEFNSLSGLQLIHLGMTSRDLTENVELTQIRRSLGVIRRSVLGVLSLMANRIDESADLLMVGRSHNVPAQLTTFGKRIATFAEELIFSLERLDSLIARIPLRGLRGPMGTRQDLDDLLGKNADLTEKEITESLGFTRVLDSTGQIYPRSIDFEVLSTLVQLAAAPANFALQVRLMSGAGLMSEGFKEGQVGSSAMPHKVNARSSERISGLATVLKGHLFMVSEISGNQWNEGDVSCSVVRRVAIADAFFAIDGIFQTMATILKEMVTFEGPIRSEVDRELPFVISTRLLTLAVKAGVGREDAHNLIQEHSLSALEKVRSGLDHSFFESIAADPRLPFSEEELHSLLSNLNDLAGDAPKQAATVSRRIKELATGESPEFEEIR